MYKTGHHRKDVGKKVPDVGKNMKKRIIDTLLVGV